MSAVVHFVEKAVDAVGSAVSNVVDNALKDPIGTIAKVAAVATGQFELLPVISAVDVVANGGSLEDAAKSAALSYAGNQISSFVGSELGSSVTGGEFGYPNIGAEVPLDVAASTPLLSPAVSQIAGNVVASGALAAATGRDPGEAMLMSLASQGLRKGIDYTIDAVGNAIDNAGNVIATPEQGVIAEPESTNVIPVPEPSSVEVTPVPEPSPIETEPIFGQAPAEVTPVPEDQTTTEAITPTETPAEVPGFKWDETTQTYVPEDAGTVDTSTSGYTIDPVTGLPVAEEPAADLNYSAVGKYLQNQLTGSFIRSLLGGNVPTYSPTRTTFTNAAGLPTTADKTATTFTTPDVGYNIGTQAQFASILPEDYLKEDKKENMSDAFSADAAEYAKQKFLESQFYDAPPEYAADGGLIGHNPQFFSEGGAGIHHRYVKGDGDGTSDSVPAMLASGEFVIPADVVSSLGNGDNDAGASVLDRFMQEIRSHKRSAKPDQLPPDSKGPLSYLKAAQKKKVKKHGRS